MEPNSLYGDKFDPNTARFMEGYRPGASVEGLDEFEDVYEISVLVKEILDLTKSPEGKIDFHKIVKKYDSSAETPKDDIEVFISRKPGYRQRYWEIDYDINKDYRLYDHEDLHTQKPVEGVISRINNLKPDLTISLHLTGGNPGKFGGMASVISPGYHVFYRAIDYVNSNDAQRKKIRKSFEEGNYGHWFISQYGRSSFEWFLCDSWIYFTGHWSTPDGLNLDTSKFRGYRQNMVTWNYRDESRLNNSISDNPDIALLNHLKYFKPQGKFWEREKSDPEMWRREGGPEGFGGDNFYASQEILRFIRKGLLVNKIYAQPYLPEIVEPYISTWSVPTYVNAVSAFIELAYLDNPYDFKRIRNLKKIQAEAIAVAIYSLLQGTKSPTSAKQQKLPWGKPVNFSKYKTYKDGDYFQLVRD